METPTAMAIDKLSAQVETLCWDWRRMRTVVERMARMEWWDLHGLRCRLCCAPFDVATGECRHEVDCIFERSCKIVGAEPLPLPNETILAEWAGVPKQPVPRSV
ncbi:MAG: hypothetical protein A2W26_01990 [Acidobacteria bacterium RBG_16_64_8]|nr:MAG: hypothetical protein A2W26_01990 [Acidobacteria bacterium RBG_16_64_8]